MSDFLYQRKQRLFLNGTYLSQANIETGTPLVLNQPRSPQPLFFPLIYINDLSDGLISNPKLFSDDNSLFSIAYDINLASYHFKNSLIKISKQTLQWGMNFYPIHSKYAQMMMISRIIRQIKHPPVFFNKNSTPKHKYIQIVLDMKVDFKIHRMSIKN